MSSWREMSDGREGTRPSGGLGLVDVSTATAFAPSEQPDEAVGHHDDYEHADGEGRPTAGESVDEKCDRHYDGDEIEAKEQAFSALAFRR
jgi:hypothetical protein